VNVDELLHNPLALGGAGLVVLILIIVVFASKGKGRSRGKVVDDTKGRARAKLRNDLKAFRDEIQRAVNAAAPVMKKIETESAQANAVGAWRKQMKHRVTVRTPDFNALKGLVRALGQDAAVLIDLDANWRKVNKQVNDYNNGAMDGSKTPILFAKEFTRDLQKMTLLVDMCLNKYVS
jgi:hypothetical protein